jgi:gliding motility-associated-like protein
VVNITISPLPISTISPATDTLCEGTSKPFSVTITGSASSPWNITYKETYLKNNTFTPSTVSENTASSTIMVTPAIAGATTDSASYAYTISKVTDSKGCDAVSMTGVRKLIVYKIPVPNAGSDASICGPLYLLTGNTNVGTGRWFYPGVPVVDSVKSGNSFTVTVDSTLSGLSWTYPFLWKVINWTCQASDQVNITFDKRASKADAGPDQSMFIKDVYDTLRAVTPVIGTGVWTKVSGGASFLNDTIVFNLTEGSNVFKWTITNGECFTFDEMTINAKNPRFPEGFSPNGDFINDEFEIQGFDPDFYFITLKIMNSAGSQVYSTDNLNGNTYKQWNGENEKGPLPDGTYYYVFTATYKETGKADSPYSGVIVLKRDK